MRKKTLADLKYYKELFILLFVTAVVILLYMPRNGIPVPERDGDTYAHLLRFEMFFKTGVFKEIIFPFANYPFGEAWHYTRIFDLVNLVLIYPFTLFSDFDTVFPVFSSIIPMIFYLFSGMFLWYGLKPFKCSFIVATLAFVLAPFVVERFLFGVFDHHFLEMFFLCGAIACALRYFKQKTRNFLCFTGLFCALMFWTSIEGFFISLCFQAAFFLIYLAKKETIKNLIIFQGVFSLACLLFLMINPPYEGFFFVELGRLSIFYVTFNFWVLATFLCLFLVPQKTGLKLLVPAVFGAAFVYLFKDGLSLQLMPPSLYEQWYWQLKDVQSVFIASFFSIFFYVPVFILSYFCSDFKKPHWIFLITGLAVFWVLALFHVRFAPFLSIFCIFSLALCFTEKTKKRDLVVALLLVFVFPSVAPRVAARYYAPPPKRMKPWTVLPYLEQTAKEGSILSDLDPAMYFAYYTRRPVTGWHFYRNPQGLLYYYEIFSSTNSMRVKSLLLEKDVRTIIVRRTPTLAVDPFTRIQFWYVLQESKRLPSYLKPVPLPPEISVDWLMFEVLRETNQD